MSLVKFFLDSAKSKRRDTSVSVTWPESGTWVWVCVCVCVTLSVIVNVGNARNRSGTVRNAQVMVSGSRSRSSSRSRQCHGNLVTFTLMFKFKLSLRQCHGKLVTLTLVSRLCRAPVTSPTLRYSHFKSASICNFWWRLRIFNKNLKKKYFWPLFQFMSLYSCHKNKTEWHRKMVIYKFFWQITK